MAMSFGPGSIEKFRVMRHQSWAKSASFVTRGVECCQCAEQGSLQNATIGPSVGPNCSLCDTKMALLQWAPFCALAAFHAACDKTG